MKELGITDKTIKNNFTKDETADINTVSEFIRRDMLRYDRMLDAQEEANEY